ncbi:hypothetical protein JCM11251_000392 [Rhodosporidiobolus azoricus]
MPSRFSALLASSRLNPSSSTSSSSSPVADPPHQPHLTLSQLHIGDQYQASRALEGRAGPLSGEAGERRGGQGQGSLVEEGRADFSSPPSSTTIEHEHDEERGPESRRFSLAMSEDAEIPQLDEAGGAGSGRWPSSPELQRYQHRGQYTDAPSGVYGVRSRQPTYQTLDALLAASSAASSSVYPSYGVQQQQPPQHDIGIGGDFSFASSFGLAEEGSPTAAPEDVSPVSPGAVSLFEQQEYFSPALSTADVGAASLFGPAPAHQPTQQQHPYQYKQSQAYLPFPSSTTSSSAAATAPIPLSRSTAVPVNAFLPPSHRETVSESPYQPFGFSPSSFTYQAPSSAPAAYNSQPHSLTGAFLSPQTAGGSGMSSRSTFDSSTSPMFSTLSASSIPPAASAPLAFATPTPGAAPSNSTYSHFGPGFLTSYRRASYAPSSGSLYSPALQNATPPSPPRSSGSVLAGAFAFGPSPLVGASAAAGLPIFSDTPPSPRETLFSSGSPPEARRGFAPASEPSSSSTSRPYPPITSSSPSSSSISKRKKRSSSAAASFLDDAYDPAYDEEASSRSRPISPITGKPTKLIAKRAWPPKDAAKRVYKCEVEGCGKSFGRPSARDTHMRSPVMSNLKRHMIVHPTVDFRSVTVHDLPLIKWVDDPDDPDGAGGRLEWIDELPVGEGEGEKEMMD